MIPVRTRVIHGGEDRKKRTAEMTLCGKGSSLSPTITQVHGDEDETASIQRKESQTSKKSETEAKMYPAPTR